MSFGKLRSVRDCDTTPKADVPSPGLGNGTGSHTSLASRRQLLSNPTKTTQRSRSLSISNKNGRSTTNLSATASKCVLSSKIPVHSKATYASQQDKHSVAKRSPSFGERNQQKLHSKMSSALPEVKSSANTVTTKASVALKLPRASTPNAASGMRSTPVTSAPSTPRTRSPLRNPGRLNHIGPTKKPVATPPTGKPMSGAKKESSKLPSDTSTPANVTGSQIHKNISGDEEIITNINLSNLEERKPFEKIPRPKEVNINMPMIGDLVNVISEECFMVCGELNDQKNSILTNLIEIGTNQNEDETLHGKIANYLNSGDKIHQRYRILKQSQNCVSSKLCELVSELNSETLSLRSICIDLEKKLELLEVENDYVSKQLKGLSEELGNEREKMVSLNQQKTQLEHQIKKHLQRIKELENKSSTSDGKIYQQSAQLKSFEGQLKQRDEKYQLLEQKLSYQAKQCRLATDVREKLEKQRESLEARVNDLKKLKTEQQNESAKIEENLREELNKAQRELENEKKLREDLEKELKNAHERLVSIQEKSLELADVSEVSKATIIQEGSLKTSDKEAQLYMNLNEVQQQLGKANEELNNYKGENEKLRTAVLQATEAINLVSGDEVAPVINVLKSEIASKDETIKRLQQQMDTYLKEANTRGHNLKTLQQKWNQEKGGIQDQEALLQEIVELRHRLVQAEKDNQRHLQLVTQKQLEVEQRERVMREQAKVLQVRDELLKLLRKKDKTKTGKMTALQAKLEDQERNVDTVNKFFSAKAEQLQEIYSTLEMKQRRVMQLEDEVKQLVAQIERGQCQRTRLEARIAELELAVHENGRTSCASSVYNPRCKASAFSPTPSNSYYTYSYHKKPQEVCGPPLSDPQNHPLQSSMNRPRYSRLHHTYVKPYSRQNEKNRSVLQLYRIHSSHWGDSNYSHTMLTNPHCQPSSRYLTEMKRAFK